MMRVSILDGLKSIRDVMAKRALYAILKPMKERYRSCVHLTAGLVVTATSGLKVPKIGATICHYQAKGKMGQIAAGTDMPALSGTVTNAKWNIFVFTVDSAGTTYSQMGTEAATEAAVKWPKLDPERAIIGYIKINPTGTGNFVGNTTSLSDATVAPNTQYISPVGMFDPTAIID